MSCRCKNLDPSKLSGIPKKYESLGVIDYLLSLLRGKREYDPKQKVWTIQK